MKIREHHNQTRKPRKTNFGKNGDRVPPTIAMVLPLVFEGLLAYINTRTY